MTLSITLKENGECHLYSLLHFKLIVLSVVMLNVVLLSVVAPIRCLTTHQRAQILMANGLFVFDRFFNATSSCFCCHTRIHCMALTLANIKSRKLHFINCAS